MDLRRRRHLNSHPRDEEPYSRSGGSPLPKIDGKSSPRSFLFDYSGNHAIALWLATFCFVGGIINTIAVCALFAAAGSPQLTPKTPAYANWHLGVLPDAMLTFEASLGSMGLAVGFAISAFRFFLFRERESRLLDYINVLMQSAAFRQLHPLLFYTLRSCMLIPASTGVFASVRDSFGTGMAAVLLLAAADPNSRPVLYVAALEITVIAIGLIDRGIEVGVFNSFQHGVWLQPVIGPNGTDRYFAYLVIMATLSSINAYYCTKQRGSDAWSRLVMLLVGAVLPWEGIVLQLVRVYSYARGNRPSTTDDSGAILTAISIVLMWSITPHMVAYSTIRCKNTLRILENRVQELNNEAMAAVLKADIATAQRDFTRYIFHEVRGPLNNMSLGVELLSGDPAVQGHDGLREIVSLLGEATRIVKRITDDVLFIGKMHSNHFNLVFAPFNVSDLVISTVKQHRRAAEVGQVQIAIDTSSEIPSILLGDANRIGQVLSNLLSNALKFVPKESGHVSITTSVLAVSTTVPAHQLASTRALEPHTGPEHSDGLRSMQQGLVSGSFSAPVSPFAQSVVPGGLVASPPNAGLGATLVRSVSRIFLPTIPQGVRESSRVTPLAVNEEEQQELVVSDPRLPFECEPSHASCHVVEVPDNLCTEETVVKVCFTVSDNGVGLSTDDQERICKPFSQIKPRREHGGTGLGLYISRNLAQQMGGILKVDSPGLKLGSTFSLEVPLRVLRRVDVSSEAGVLLSAPSSSSENDGGLSGPASASATASVVENQGLFASPVNSWVRLAPVTVTPIDAAIAILIVDDVDSSRMLMRRLITQHAQAAIITEAADGNAACAAMLAAKEAGSLLFSRGIICMDKEMPQCDGFLAAKEIRGMGFAGLILGVTGNAIAEDITRFIECGADAVITKPVSVPALMSHIRAFVSASATNSFSVLQGQLRNLPEPAIL